MTRSGHPAIRRVVRSHRYNPAQAGNGPASGFQGFVGRDHRNAGVNRAQELALRPAVDPIGESGQPLTLSDFRAGDTLWVTSRTSGEEITAVHVRKGRMDVADLHRYYLDYAEIK